MFFSCSKLKLEIGFGRRKIKKMLKKRVCLSKKTLNLSNAKYHSIIVSSKQKIEKCCGLFFLLLFLCFFFIVLLFFSKQKKKKKIANSTFPYFFPQERGCLMCLSQTKLSQMSANETFDIKVLQDKIFQKITLFKIVN